VEVCSVITFKDALLTKLGFMKAMFEGRYVEPEE
jgi:hypothetical protein